jgi:uroporphyrinogen decarboxylase
MNSRENYLRAVRFERPERIPMHFVINAACWHHYPQAALQELQASHPLLFPGFQPRPLPYTPQYGLNSRADAPYTDAWGCRWETTDNGIVGAVTSHPLAEWTALATYTPPDPATTDGIGPLSWPEIAQRLARQRAAGELVGGGLTHGHTFLRLCDLCGYEQVLCAMADDDPRLHRVLGWIEEFNAYQVRQFVQLGVEVMGYPEDLGMQVGPMLSPAHFHRYLVPLYQRLMAPARAAGCLIHMHSDGDIRLLVDGLIEGGVDIVNLQDLVNGLDWIAERFAGRTCVDLDIDRQVVTRFGTPAQIDALIREAVTKIGRREGGLTMVYGLYPGVPLANAKALMDSLERYATYYA